MQELFSRLKRKRPANFSFLFEKVENCTRSTNISWLQYQELSLMPIISSTLAVSVHSNIFIRCILPSMLKSSSKTSQTKNISQHNSAVDVLMVSLLCMLAMIESKASSSTAVTLQEITPRGTLTQQAKTASLPFPL